MPNPDPFQDTHLEPFNVHSSSSSSTSSSSSIPWLPLSHPIRDFSLIFIIDQIKSKILLGLKRRGFGQNLYNGFGGKPELGETIRQCAMREAEEECGIVISDENLLHSGDLYIARAGIETVHITIYCSLTYSGQIRSSDEMEPKWMSITELPLDQMWPEARIYLPPMIEKAIASTSSNQSSLLRGRVDYDHSGKISACWMAFEDSQISSDN